MDYLKDIVIILAVAVLLVAVLHRLRVPSIAAFVLAGMLVGPESLALIDDVHKVEILAEVGVVLLLFGIGLELSPAKIKSIWRHVVLGGLLQVGLTTAITVAVATILGVEFNRALFLGLVVSLSSTAIVLQGLQQRGEVDAPHGRLTLGILVFQDFAVVPIMLALPLLAGAATESGAIVRRLLLAPVIIAGILVLASIAIPRILNLVVRTRQRHLFALAVLVICVGVAFLVSNAGVSLALGAFLAGLVVAGGEFRHQAVSDVLPLRDVFTSLFFISVGMLISPSHLFAQIGTVLTILLALLIVKALVVFVTALILRLHLRVAVLAGMALAQVGEFAFVLLAAAKGTQLYTEPLMTNLLAAVILSMFLTPFAIALGPHLAAGAMRLKALEGDSLVRTAREAASHADKVRDHIIIGGYGFAGAQLARILRECSVPYLIADLNVENVRRARSEGEPAFFGDITSQNVLELLGAEKARQFVIAINDPNATIRAIAAARALSHDLNILVRTSYVQDKDALLAAGADEVVPAEQEAAVELTRRVLLRCKPELADKPEQLDYIRQVADEAKD